MDIATKEFSHLEIVGATIQMLRIGKGNDVFRNDLQRTKFHGIGRFSTLTLQNETGKGIIIVGYRPYENLRRAFIDIKNLNLDNAPLLMPVCSNINMIYALSILVCHRH